MTDVSNEKERDDENPERADLEGDVDGQAPGLYVDDQRGPVPEPNEPA